MPSGAARYNQLSHAINSKLLQRSYGPMGAIPAAAPRSRAGRTRGLVQSMRHCTSRPLITAHVGAQARPAARASTRAPPRDMDCCSDAKRDRGPAAPVPVPTGASRPQGAAIRSGAAPPHRPHPVAECRAGSLGARYVRPHRPYSRRRRPCGPWHQMLRLRPAGSARTIQPRPCAGSRCGE